jgi:cyclopropane-fatty-acyl-phospholipid synthase
MRPVSIDSPQFLQRSAKPAGLNRIARRAVHSRLRELAIGQIVISENGEHTTYGQLTDEFPLTAQLRVHHPRFYSDVAFGGSVGAGEAYIQGYWSCDELTDLSRIMLRNRDVLEQVDSGLAWLSRPLQKFFHFLNRNSVDGSRRNIAAHYDLGNDFYQLWLDKSMMYSSAWFES